LPIAQRKVKLNIFRIQIDLAASQGGNPASRCHWSILSSRFAVFSVTARLISQPLAFDAEQRALDTSGVVHAQADAVAVAEIELGQMAMQMLLFAVLIYAFHAALEH
jgi:hypothetical protein